MFYNVCIRDGHVSLFIPPDPVHPDAGGDDVFVYDHNNDHRVMATVIVIMMVVPPSRFLPCLSLLWVIPCFIQAPIGGKAPGLLQWRVAPC